MSLFFFYKIREQECGKILLGWKVRLVRGRRRWGKDVGR
jgi:hypothetical protein